MGYQLGPNSLPVYALEGSVAVAGAALTWLRDNLNLLNNHAESESLAEEVMTTGDVYFVPAFSGLYAPYWRKDARGCVLLSIKNMFIKMFNTFYFILQNIENKLLKAKKFYTKFYGYYYSIL